MKLLILGGTVFLGRALVEAALARGHDVTIFTRGQHNPELFPEIEKLRGDRDGNLAALEGRRWDAVIDTCGYVPRIVSDSARLLAYAVEHYTFISSVSVYAHPSNPGLDEEAPVGTLADPTEEAVTGETYGPLKALCEQAVEATLPGRALVIRPGLIVGPHDPTDRFTYWPSRVARGGEVLAPEPRQQPVQIVDVRDLAEWNIRLVEQRRTGSFNAVGPDYRLSFEQLLDTCKRVSASGAEFTWVAPRFLVESGVGPWMELPLWVPSEGDQGSGGLMQTSNARAVAAGLTFRPVEQSVRDTLTWDAARPPDITRRAGLAPEKERKVLAAWHNR